MFPAEIAAAPKGDAGAREMKDVRLPTVNNAKHVRKVAGKNVRRPSQRSWLPQDKSDGAFEPLGLKQTRASPGSSLILGESISRQDVRRSEPRSEQPRPLEDHSRPHGWKMDV